MSPVARERWTRSLLAVAGVALTTGFLILVDPQLAVASLVYVVVVVLASVFGYVPGAVAAVCSYLSLNYWFTPTYESFAITRFDDLMPLLTFALTVVVLGTTVARVGSLRRRALEQERAAFKARVDAALSESRAGFLSAMTHSLRTPLASIKAASTTLRSHPGAVPPDLQAMLLDTVYGEADRLERLVSKVLELSRIRAGALEPEWESTDVGELARNAMHRLRHLRPDVRLRLDEEPEEVLADVDPAMLEVVIVILLENALRFAPDGTDVSAVVRLEPPTDASPATVCLQIIDQGSGVDPADRERIFEEFVRVDSAGTGLGLTIARAICEAHDGSISVDPTPGPGATFVVRIPAHRLAR